MHILYITTLCAIFNCVAALLSYNLCMWRATDTANGDKHMQKYKFWLEYGDNNYYTYNSRSQTIQLQIRFIIISIKV